MKKFILMLLVFLPIFTFAQKTFDNVNVLNSQETYKGFEYQNCKIKCFDISKFAVYIYSPTGFKDSVKKFEGFVAISSDGKAVVFEIRNDETNKETYISVGKRITGFSK